MRGIQRALFFGIVLIILCSVFIMSQVVVPDFGHSASEVFVTIEGCQMTLQEAFDNNFLKDNSDGTGKASIPSSCVSVIPEADESYHNGDSIYVDLGGVEYSIQAAIDNKVSFCREQTSFSLWKYLFGHSKIEVILDYAEVGENFQWFIDHAKFCGYHWEYGDWSSCSSCGETQTRSVTCVRSNGDVVSDSSLCGSPQNTKTCDTEWDIGSWGDCSNSCGDGTQTRSVYCYSCVTGGSVSDDLCVGTTKPSLQQDCDGGDYECGWEYSRTVCTEDTCGEGWNLGEYTCSVIGHCYCLPAFASCTAQEVKRIVAVTRDQAYLFGGHCYIGDTCGWGDWSAWSECKATTLWKERTKTCNNAAGCMENGVYFEKDKVFSELGEMCPIKMGGSSSVLCTEAYRQGYLSDEFYNADVEFAQKYMSEEVMIGYHSWAKPLVRVIQRNKEISNRVMPLSVEWAKHMAFVMGESNEDSEIGKSLLENGVVYCEELGNLLKEEGYTLENEYEFNDVFIEEIFLENFGIFLKESLGGNKDVISENFENIMKDIINYYLVNQKIKSFDNFNYDSSLTKYL